MKKQRLLKLADLLDADAANKKGIKFDLQSWAADGETGNRDFTGVTDIPVNCSTAACAVGLACLSGAFAGSGLGYEIAWDGALIPTFGEERDWYAVERFFGLSEQYATYLFMASEYPKSKRTRAAGERYVAKRIRKFVEDGGRV